jgi:hypothetical protein
MRICLAATTGFKKLVTCSSSEPLLAEAAFRLMSATMSSPVKHLANHSNLYCVDRGRRGELVASLIIMQARDAALPEYSVTPSQRWVHVTEFMKALLPQHKSEELLNSLPTLWREGEESRTFQDTFDNCRLWFNHIIKVEDSTVITPVFLWKFVLRGAMVVCKENQQGIDIILPVVWLGSEPDGPISSETVSSIIIQVKNSSTFNSKITTKLFDAMDPLGLGLLGVTNPRPMIRMVMALASPEARIGFPDRPTRETRVTRYSKFTSFDIWCAGLSTDTYQQIGDDIDAYRKLLDRSQQSHDVFNVSQSYNPISDMTKEVVGMVRQSMAPLIKSSDHDSFIF